MASSAPSFAIISPLAPGMVRLGVNGVCTLVFDGWNGDEIFTDVGRFFVSVQLAKRVDDLRSTGVSFSPALAANGEKYRFSSSPPNLPEIKQLVVSGSAKKDDFGILPDGSLVVSGSILEVLRAHAPKALLVKDEVREYSFEEKKRAIYEHTMKEIAKIRQK